MTLNGPCCLLAFSSRMPLNLDDCIGASGCTSISAVMRCYACLMNVVQVAHFVRRVCRGNGADVCSHGTHGQLRLVSCCELLRGTIRGVGIPQDRICGLHQQLLVNSL